MTHDDALRIVIALIFIAVVLVFGLAQIYIRLSEIKELSHAQLDELRQGKIAK